jgi:hypothetical protein
MQNTDTQSPIIQRSHFLECISIQNRILNTSPNYEQYKFLNLIENLFGFKFQIEEGNDSNQEQYYKPTIRTANLLFSDTERKLWVSGFKITIEHKPLNLKEIGVQVLKNINIKFEWFTYKNEPEKKIDSVTPQECIKYFIEEFKSIEDLYVFMVKGDYLKDLDTLTNIYWNVNKSISK